MATEKINLTRGLPGETPLDDISGLKLPWVRTVAALSKVEFTNVGKAIYKYTARKPTCRLRSRARAVTGNSSSATTLTTMLMLPRVRRRPHSPYNKKLNAYVL